ncbi:dihydrofolate reductase family protein [Piscinibacter sp.]|uniref:dihydrofolate reductase family protein n=1 Tax=Piscinibacter sp. TaxID=1903157 RepID=UPI002BC0A6B1|nr:dihydrofolate reductase family protein [Albitalea sp.]HUG22774.1 dihydrofolate reductase family protein [Albitalea sp.]
MAKLVFSNLVSLDGYCAGPGGDLSRLPMGSAFDDHNVALLRTAGTLLFGRITFGMFHGYWPQVEKDPSAAPVLAEIAALTRKIDKLVVSDTLSLLADAPWRDTEVVRRAQAHARIQALKASTERDLLAYGSTVLMNDLLAHGLVDELRLLMGNVVLGEGVRTFEEGLPPPLTLLEERRLAGSDIVMLRYACAAHHRARRHPW